jgi:hypothetical protein
LTAVLDTSGVQGSANDVVANTGKILDSSSTDEDHRVLLEVMADATDVSRDLEPGGEAYTGHFA